MFLRVGCRNGGKHKNRNQQQEKALAFYGLLL
jgi:hypothetical protein